MLALLAVASTGARVYTIGFTMSDEIDGLRSRLLVETVVEDETAGWLAFVDRFGMRWQVSLSAGAAGKCESLDLWLDLA